MSKELLEDICAEIDSQVMAGEVVHIGEVLRIFDADSHPNNLKYTEFVRSYTTLTEGYYNKRIALRPNKYENIDLGRVLFNMCVGGFFGSVFDPYAGIVGGFAGGGLTVYDERKKKDMNLLPVAGGAVLGGVIGSFIDAENSHVYIYIGAGIGASLGFAIEFFEAKNREQKIKQLDDKHNHLRDQMIAYTVKVFG